MKKIIHRLLFGKPSKGIPVNTLPKTTRLTGEQYKANSFNNWYSHILKCLN